MQYKIKIKSKFRLGLDKREALIMMVPKTMDMSKRNKRAQKVTDNAHQKMEAMLKIR